MIQAESRILSDVGFGSRSGRKDIERNTAG
jgi:hypothetical protein